jgi:hypothetical protein
MQSSSPGRVGTRSTLDAGSPGTDPYGPVGAAVHPGE